MGKILVIASTILIILVLIGLRRKNNKKILLEIKSTFIEINQTYKEILTENDLISRVLHGVIFVVSELLVIFTVVKVGVNNVLQDASITNIIVTTFFVIIILLIIHLSIGYILLITTGIQKFISKVEDSDLKINLLTSYFILSTYFTVFVFDSSQFEGIEILALIGLLISYILNLKILIKLIKNPGHVKNKDKENNIYKTTNSRITIVAILLLFMIILNLFLATSIINQAYPGSFSNNPNGFDLFYYTIITFTTIGYGDIVPISIPAKIISMTIAVTSVICLTIFLSTVISYKKENE
ncbi:potassium channel family protein [Romboutsia sp.]|uniref:potassium channel family protein n=1 Tax=Romboutsia sp. TaxID=1965302 RepID=UPI003F2AF22D